MISTDRPRQSAIAYCHSRHCRSVTHAAIWVRDRKPSLAKMSAAISLLLCPAAITPGPAPRPARSRAGCRPGRGRRRPPPPRCPRRRQTRDPPQRVGQRVRQRPPGLLADAEGGRHPRDDQVGLMQVGPTRVGQLDQERPVGELRGRRGQDPQRQPGLPDAAGPAQGQRARLPQHPAQLGDLALAADEAVGLLGQMSVGLVHVTRPRPLRPARNGGLVVWPCLE